MHNSLNEAQVERLVIMQEAAAEVIHACSKILRYGYDSYHPSTKMTNSDALHAELADFVWLFNKFAAEGEISKERVHQMLEAKARLKKAYTKHQGEDMNLEFCQECRNTVQVDDDGNCEICGSPISTDCDCENGQCTTCPNNNEYGEDND